MAVQNASNDGTFSSCATVTTVTAANPAADISALISSGEASGCLAPPERHAGDEVGGGLHDRAERAVEGNPAGHDGAAAGLQHAPHLTEPSRAIGEEHQAEHRKRGVVGAGVERKLLAVTEADVDRVGQSGCRPPGLEAPRPSAPKSRSRTPALPPLRPAGSTSRGRRRRPRCAPPEPTPRGPAPHARRSRSRAAPPRRRRSATRSHGSGVASGLGEGDGFDGGIVDSLMRSPSSTS